MSKISDLKIDICKKKIFSISSYKFSIVRGKINSNFNSKSNTNNKSEPRRNH